ncbi:DUF397 domain-containing protein, partial [Streptomyces sp. 8K308]|uniref:DUF397 domain-containing protein n=1 Tax=Streptomyces sp. 8K308 TaxID=2530388 RepID=UPI0010455051
PEDLTAATWFKSSASNAQNECVEVARLGSAWAGIRDSKNPEHAALIVPAGAFAELVAFVSR